MKVRSESEVAQSCLTLSDPMDCSPPGSPVPGIFQAGVLEWGAIAFSGFPSWNHHYCLAHSSQIALSLISWILGTELTMKATGRVCFPEYPVLHLWSEDVPIPFPICEGRMCWSRSPSVRWGCADPVPHLWGEDVPIPFPICELRMYWSHAWHEIVYVDQLVTLKG